jgi:hypothetical protein
LEGDVNNRQKTAENEAHPDVATAQTGTIRIGGQYRSFDDSKAPTIFVDVLTESGTSNGIVYLGVGHLISPLDGTLYAAGDVHLRMSVHMATGVVEALSEAIRRATEQHPTKNVGPHKSN